MLQRAVYEVLAPRWPLPRGKTRWVNFLADRLHIAPYGRFKTQRIGKYELLLDPGDANDRAYYFGVSGRAYRTLMDAILQPGDTVIDVGANVGHFAAEAALRVEDGGTVHAFEANPALAERLHFMVQRVRGGPIEVHHAAISSGGGTLPFHVATVSGWSSLIENATYSAAQTVDVPALTIDSFLKEHNITHVRMLKLDIEGGETDALLGAQDALRSGLIDYVLFEAETFRLRAFEHTPEELESLFLDTGYEFGCMIENEHVTYPLPMGGQFNRDYLAVRTNLPPADTDAVMRLRS